MAKLGVFGRRTEEDRDPPTAVGSASVTDRTVIVDRDKDGVDDRVGHREVQEERLITKDDPRDTNHDGVVSDPEAQAAHERTQARLAARERLATQEGAQEDRIIDRDHDGVDDRVEARPAPPPPAPKVRAQPDAHHVVEAQFKAVARALRQAVAVDPRSAGEVPSTKGVL